MSLIQAYELDTAQAFFMEFRLHFVITNVGNIVASLWQNSIRRMSLDDDIARPCDILFENFPRPRGATSIPFGSRAILPGCAFEDQKDLGMLLRPNCKNRTDLAVDLDKQLLSLVLHCQIAVETSPGSLIPVALRAKFNLDELVEAAAASCPEFFTGLLL